MKQKIKKNRLKIFIALSLMITCVFGVMFATNTFAYDVNGNYNISTTIENITNSSFTSLENKSFNNNNNIKPYIELKDSALTYNTFNFNLILEDNVNVNIREYVFLMNYDFGYYDNNNAWISYTNSNTYIQFTSKISSTTANWNSVYLMSNFSQDNNFNYQYRTLLGQYNNASGFYYTTINNQTNISISIRDPNQSTNRYLRIYNIDMVKNDEITLTSYYSSIQEQYNELLEDFNTLSDNYSDLDDMYDELRNDYDTLYGQYEDLQDNYNNLEESYDNIITLNNNGIWDNIYSLNVNYKINGTNESTTYTKQELIDNNYLLDYTLRLSDIAHSINADNQSYKFEINFNNINMPNYTKNIDINLITNTQWAHSIDFQLQQYNSDGSVSAPTIIYMSASANDIISNSYNINYTWLYLQTIEGYNLQALYTRYNVFNKIVFDYNEYITIGNNDTIYLKSNNSTFMIGYQQGLQQGNTNAENRINELNNTINELTNRIENLEQVIETKNEQIALYSQASYGLNNLMWTIGGTPFESFKQIWNVEFLGVDIANFILGIITTFIGLYIVKKFFL